MVEKKVKTFEIDQKLSFHAAVLIQCWYRKCKARLEIRRKCAWQVNQSLEYVTDEGDSEGLQSILSNFADLDDASNKFLLSRELSFVSDFNFNFDTLNFPVPEEDFLSFLAWIKSDKKIPVNFFILILNKAVEILRQQANLTEISLEKEQYLTICGDLHGNLLAATKIFEETGLPNCRNRILFNGDFVDRGVKSVEVLSLLLMALLTYPNDIFLNRGNHEDIVMNERYGFVKELSKKYPKDTKNLIHYCDELFCALPIGAIVNDKIFVCHGGISKHTDIKKLKLLNRFKLSSILQPCLDGENSVNLDDWQQILDLLWSDPQDKNGCRLNSFRGAGCYFGPDITEKFLITTNFSMIIRSHECCIEGWRILHSGKVLTLFSSFDYFILHSNQGAYARITVIDSNQTYITDAKAVTSLHLTSDTSKNSFSELFKIYISVFIINNLENQLSNHNKILDDPVNIAFVCLWQRIIRHKDKLMERFNALDFENSGIILVSEWCDIMASVTQLKLSWRCLRSFLVKLSSNCPDKVVYTTMFTGNCVLHPDLPGENLLANEVFEVQSHLLAIAQACHFQNSNVNFYGLLNRLESFGDNWRIIRLKCVISKLIDKFKNVFKIKNSNCL
ncbi:unnamed protein product [Heterobilharzia americana]|nr:unnamed protein product [Heterobilharzia americana]